MNNNWKIIIKVASVYFKRVGYINKIDFHNALGKYINNTLKFEN